MKTVNQLNQPLKTRGKEREAERDIQSAEIDHKPTLRLHLRVDRHGILLSQQKKQY